MKKITLSTTVVYMIISIFLIRPASIYSQTSETSKVVRLLCGQELRVQNQRLVDPDFDKIKQENENAFQAYVQKMEEDKQSGTLQPNATYVIPIVVHILYNTASQNLSDATVLATIKKLNEDWNKQNADTVNIPAVWKPIAANMQITFCLANKDPSGNTTTGIIHKSTSVASFDYNGDDMMYSNKGGDSPWDENKYLNIWYCEMNGPGFAYGPPIFPNSYGLILNYKMAVGGVYDPTGRIISHEIGHCFNLRHTFEGGCTGDGVTDTPPISSATNGCPSGVVTDACSPSAPGIMYQNHMDYTNGSCHVMFTNGQKARAQAAIAQYLMGLVNSASTVCSGATGVEENVLFNNISVYPNPSTGDFSISLNPLLIGSVDMTVINSFGETIIQSNREITADNKIELKLNDMPNGIYLIKMSTLEGIVVRKVVKMGERK